MENYTDLLGIIVGMMGALLKALKKRLKLISTILVMITAGILCYTLIGVVQLYYGELPEKASLLIAFVVGWTANEITDKMDLFIDDIYNYFTRYINNRKNGK